MANFQNLVFTKNNPYHQLIKIHSENLAKDYLTSRFIFLGHTNIILTQMGSPPRRPSRSNRAQFIHSHQSITHDFQFGKIIQTITMLIQLIEDEIEALKSFTENYFFKYS